MAAAATRTVRSLSDARNRHGKATEVLRNPAESSYTKSGHEASTSARRGGNRNCNQEKVKAANTKSKSVMPTSGRQKAKARPGKYKRPAEFKSPADSMPLPDVPLPDGFKRSEFSGKGYKASETSVDAMSTDKIIRELNNVRCRHGLKAVTENPLLTSSAQAKAEDMARHGYFAHESPKGKRPHDFVREAGYQYVKVAENILVSTNTSENDCISSWMNSRHHRDNILHGKFTEVGIGVTQGTYKGRLSWMLVQHFGTSQPSVPLPEEHEKAKLNELKETMDKIKTEMNQKRKLLSNTSAKARGYNAIVDEVNELVDKFNSFNTEYRKLSESYNQKVREYNRRVRECM